MNTDIIRIAIIGPESSGKSELCSLLAKHFSTVWVPEFARSYLPNLKSSYTVNDIVEIYQSQFEQEQGLLASADKLIFIDTEFIIAKVWCENAFGFCPEYIDEMITSNPYDLYLLTSPDLPWEYDPLRENPGKGAYFFDWYHKILMEKKLNFEIVSGVGQYRILNAIEAIDKHFKT